MKNLHRLLHTALVASTALAGSSTLHAETRDDEIRALRQQIELLDQKLRVLERKQEIQEEDSAAAAKTAAKITANDKGFTVASNDAANTIRFRGLVQLDSRLFFNDGGIVNNSFILRRVRPILEGTFAKNYSLQFVPEFGGSAVSILDANLGVTVSKALQLKFGKFKTPVGLELLQSDSTLFFAERALPSNLVPNRDLGIQASGDLLEGTVSYAAGIFNGLPDNANSTNADFDNDKDVAARVMTAPFKNAPGSFLQGLNFGVSGSLGRQKTAAGRTSAYRTDGQQTFFSYLPAATADGQTWRVSPQFDYRNGPLGVFGEYVVSVVNVRPSATGPKTELRNKSWQLAGGYVVTGEDSSWTGVVPKVNFDLNAGTWGALEVTARYANLKIDDKAFPLFASAAANADEASSVGIGANWYLSKTVRFMFDYFQTNFDFNSAAPAVPTAAVLRQDEKAFITRFQVAF